MKTGIVLVIALIAISFVSGCTQLYDRDVTGDQGDAVASNETQSISDASDVANSVEGQIIDEEESIDIGSII
ncbi:hypothetical protein COT72_05495 [archaeon CG10_big_fil_rev_8_21_14_0_10_43_11]|nr:MAG: hypothetical protein COT72_05495 [archaeon CG10_big_fil_rev_8_21_14_0_10_43_11]